MAFEDLRENLAEQLRYRLSSIKESSIFMTLKEKYEILPVNIQKGLKISVLCIGILSVSVIPYSYFNSAWQFEEDFEIQKESLEKMLKASSISSTAGSTRTLTPEDLIARINSKLEVMDLLPPQIEGVLISENEPRSTFLPEKIKQNAIKVSLKKLNLQQIVEIGNALQSVNSNIKMTNLSILASTDETSYYDVNYIFKTFEFDEPKDDDKKSRRGKKRGK